MLFNQLSIGDKVYIIEVVGTFKKTTEYNEGSVTQVSAVYDEPLPPGQFPMPNQTRKRVVDITIQCNGETKKFTIPENKSVITDNSIGLTISTDKQEIINIVRNQYNTYKQRKEAIAKCDEEMAKCQVLLDKLGVDNEPARENDKILELQKEVSELKNIIRKANQMVPPPMKEMLPQDMKNAMDKVCLLYTSLHDFLDTVCLRRIDKDPHYIVVIPQNIVRRPSYDDAGALIGDLPDDLILGLDRLLYHIQMCIRDRIRSDLLSK